MENSPTGTSVEELLKEVDRLGTDDLRAFVAATLEMRSRRLAPLASARESELLVRINEGLPAELSTRLEELGAKRDAETLTDEEYAELLLLGDRVEQTTADRLRLLGELATIRQAPLDALMRQLGLAIQADG